MAHSYCQGICGDALVCFLLQMLAGESASKAKCTIPPSSAYHDLLELVCLIWNVPHDDTSNDPGQHGEHSKSFHIYMGGCRFITSLNRRERRET